MGFLFSVTFATIFISLLNGQYVLAALKWKGMIDPLSSQWDNFDLGRSTWDSDDTYLDNVVDGSDYRLRPPNEYTDLPQIQYFIVNLKPVPPKRQMRTLSDLFRSNEITDILGTGGRLYDEKGFKSPVNGISRDYANLIPSEMMRSRPFRMATLESIGFGPRVRYYR